MSSKGRGGEDTRPKSKKRIQGHVEVDGARTRYAVREQGKGSFPEARVSHAVRPGNVTYAP
jgi:hypothetical protein